MRVDHELYFISMAARLLDMHPQTLRKYERLGLVQPTRTLGSMRVYSQEQLDRLRLIKKLVDDEGVNLAGVQRLLEIAESLQRIRPLMTAETGGRDARRSTLPFTITGPSCVRWWGYSGMALPLAPRDARSARARETGGAKPPGRRMMVGL